MAKWDSILIFGPPGSGKGTLAKVLAKAGGHFHCSSGDIFRAIPPESEAGKRLASYLDKGQLVPDRLVIEIWTAHVKRAIERGEFFPKEQLMLLDGLPRTLGQAEVCDDFLNVKGVIVLEAEEHVLLERMKGRAAKEGRNDDADARVLHTRMQVYQTQTAEVLSHYPDELLTQIAADQRPLEVVRDVLNALVPVLSDKFRLG